MKYYFAYLVGAIFIGCQSGEKQTEKEQIIADQQLKIQELQQRIEERETAKNPRDARNPNYDIYKDPDLVQIDLSKYAFAIITVESKIIKSVFIDGEFYHPEEKQIHKHVTDIHEIQFYSEEKALKFRDKVRTTAKFSQYMNSKITQVDVRIYSTYKEATQAREKVDNEGEVAVFLPQGI